MECQAIDLKAYCFGEASANERREAELHMKSCAGCRDELTRLQFVEAALGGLREEEPPRRIAFVSDKVFEPNWWQRFWASGPRVGFAGAGLLSTAILVHAFTRPVVIEPSQQAPVVAQQQQVNPQEIQERIDSAVAKAVARIEEQKKSEVTQFVAATEKKFALDQKAIELLVDDNYLLRKQNTQMRVQSAGLVKE